MDLTFGTWNVSFKKWDGETWTADLAQGRDC